MMPPKSFGLKVSPSSVLKNLLQHYPSGGQFISEALQNAEDTNRSTHVCAALDLQQHPEQRIRQDFQPWRGRLQGPGFLFYDNGGFFDRDWSSLERIYDSEKKHSPSEVGKYGMGSRSFFHIGDVIQIVSGSTYAVLDPDERVSKKGDFGASLDFVKDRFDGKRFLDAYPDECAPFRGMFGCTMESSFKGTIIRVPLRLAWAEESTFMPTAFSTERAKKVFQDFENQLAGGHMALFLPRLQNIELHMREPGGNLECKVSIVKDKKQTGLLDVKNYLTKFDTTEQLQEALKMDISSAPRVGEVVRMTLKCGSGEEKKTWMRIGRFFHCKSSKKSLKKLPEEVPFVCLAIPLDEPCKGLAFAHLPLPLETGLPVHLHAGFALHDNRREIWHRAADWDGQHETWADWNDYILQDVAPHVYADALKTLQASLPLEKWFGLWPRPDQTTEDFKALVAKLVNLLAAEAILRTASGEKVAPREAKLLNLPTGPLEKCREDLEMQCLKAGMKIVNLPDHVARLLTEHKAIEEKEAFSAIKEAVIERECNKQLRQRILLALMHWADGSFTRQRMNDLASLLKDTKWIHTVGGSCLAISETFDPAAKLPELDVVRRCTADLSEALKLQFKCEEVTAVWKALRQCGLKQQITWEDAMAEARHIESTHNQKLSKILFGHLEAVPAMAGDKSHCLKILHQLEWVVVHIPPSTANKKPTESGSTLASLRNVFPAGESKFVWAVESTLNEDGALLKAGRSVQREPKVLVSQLEALARAAPAYSNCARPRNPFWSMLEPPPVREAGPDAFRHIRLVLEELAQRHKDSAEQLLQRLSSLAYVPCQGAKAGSGALLFRPKYAAHTSAQGHQKLLPAFGVVHPLVHQFACATGAPNHPDAEALVDAIPCWDSELAVALCSELAEHPGVQAGFPEYLKRLKLPTNSGKFCPLETVYINDAQWKGAGGVQTLDDRISHDHGRKLGCKSVRERLKQECEDGAEDEDAFGQEADLVDQVKLILRDYSGKSDVVAEFVQNTDDFGATELTFELSNQKFDKERVVDSRCTALQGPALYILSNKELHEEDIKNMQRVGRSAKGFDFASTGRFGVGMNVMYRYSDCPQLFANGCLHFFDLTREFVAKHNEKRGKQFKQEKLEEMFPDSVQPFRSYTAQYPVVFRLPLRTRRSELGEKVDLASVENDLRDVSAQAFSMLLFAKWLKKIRFQCPQGPLAEHSVHIDDKVQARQHQEFFASLPAELGQVGKSQDKDICVTKRISSKSFKPSPTTSHRTWVVAYTLAFSQGTLRRLCIDHFNSALGGALLPLGAAAAPLDNEKSEGRICCGLPTPLRSGSRCWISAHFILQSSRKQLLLPENTSEEKQQERQWNLQLIQYPAAVSLKTVLLKCRVSVRSRQDVDTFFQLIPCQQAQPLEAELAISTLWAAREDAIFPVLSSRDSEEFMVDWVPGPRPLLRTADLSDKLQDQLAFDGLQVASLPGDAFEVYRQVLEMLEMEEPRKLDATELCDFLAETWAGLRRSVFEIVALENTGMTVLSDPKSVLKLLQFVMPRSDPLATHRCEHLEGVPLLLTHGNDLCGFGEENVRFNTDYALLPNHRSLFIHRDAWKVFTGACGNVKPIGVRQLELDDLLPYRSEVETLALVEPAFDKSSYLRHLWNFMSNRSQGCNPFHVMESWRILPVRSHGSGNRVVPLDFATQTVALAENQQKIEMALLHAGLFLLQSGVLSSQKPFLKSKVVQSDRDVIMLLVAQKDHLVNLTETDRHDLLSHFSLLVISESSQVPAHDIRKLPLFKLASGGFTDLCREHVVHCCLHPNDKHAHALEQLMPSNAVLLSYPTKSTKPIYEFLGIQLCNGEDFMVQFIIPELPKVCADSTKAAPYLDELREFVVVEKSQKVTEAAKATAFVPNVEGRLKMAQSLIHPSKGPVAQLFANCLSADLPADWLHEPRYLAVLSRLGLKLSIPAPLLLKCAQELHSHRTSISMTEDLREKSFHLVETLAHQMAANFSEPLVKAAQLHILVTASLASDEELRKEIEKSLTLSGPRKWKHDSLRLRPFGGTAFDQCASLLWITCPVALHAYTDHKPVQLEHLIEYHATEMRSVLGAYVAPKDAPFPSLAKHMLKLCSLPHPDEEELLLPASKSRFQEELKACLEEAKRRTWTDSDLKQLSQFSDAHARCVKIVQSDAAEKPENPTILASPRRCFFFKVSESALVAADFQGHLRQADDEFRQLYEKMGVKNSPDVYDLARVTQRVAEKIQHNEEHIMADDKEVLQSCVKGFHCCVQSLGDESDESLEPLKFFLPDQDKKMGEVSKLAWLDMDCWKDRLCHPGPLRFCMFQGKEVTDAMLQSLSCAGLKPVSSLVEEIAASEVDVLDVHPESLQDTLRKFFSSPLFSQGFQAMLQSDDKYGNDCGPMSQKMVEEKLQHLVIKSVPRDFTSLLRWIDGQQVLEGSEKNTCAVLQSDQLLISDDAFNFPDRAVSDMFAAFCQMPGLVCCLKLVERPFKEVLKLAFNKGPTGIADVLRSFQIDNELDTDMCLGIGDRLPKELHKNLNYAMNVAFEVGEYVIAEQSGEFTVARVAPWNDELDGKPRAHDQRGLMRRYRVQVSKNGYETMCHHCLYKISGVSQNSGASSFQSYSICLAAGPGNDAEVVSQNHREMLNEVKAQLRDMAKMESADYKKALHRLFLRWHPDKSGNTPFNNLIFRMLKKHEVWFRNGGGDDRWLDEFGVDAEALQEDAVKTTEESEQGWEEPWAEPEPKAYRAYRRKSSQASWFQEFEEEWKSQKQPPQRQAPTKHSPPVRVWIQPEPQTWTLPRTVNESQASIWLSQAEYDLQTALHLKEASDSAGRPFSSPAVFHASQAVEKALKSAMLRTCGLTTEEFTGQEGHDLEALHLRLKGADPETEPQKLAQDQLPGTTPDMAWLKKAYLATRYPNVLGAGQIPALAYCPSDAERACHLAQQVVPWAKNLEDLPPRGEPRRKPARFWTDTEDTEEKTSRVAPAPPSGPVIQEPPPASLPASLPKRRLRQPQMPRLLRSSTPPPLAARSVKRIRRLSNTRNAQRNKRLRLQMLDHS